MMKARPLLIISLLVNIALISFIATKAVRDDHPQRFRANASRELPRELAVLSNLEVLTPEQQAAVRAVIEPRLGDLRQQSTTARDAFRQFRTLINSADFDPQTALVAARSMIETRQVQQENATQIMIEALSVLPPEARKKLFEARRERRESRREGHQGERRKNGNDRPGRDTQG